MRRWRERRAERQGRCDRTRVEPRDHTRRRSAFEVLDPRGAIKARRLLSRRPRALA
jgi:hypothetical protein